MDVKALLPNGSVVLLEGAEKKLMIIGVKQTDMNGDKKEYDYIGVLYPEGYIGAQFQYLFNHEDIDKIIFRGCSNEERDAFVEKLAALYEKQ